jgi:hypothetical protein
MSVLMPVSCSSRKDSSTASLDINQPTQVNSQKIVPYVPPQYYACSETTPQDLVQSYFLRYGNTSQAENSFNGQIFVFKNLTITSSALEYATDDYIWVYSIIKCYFLKSGTLKDLKAGDKVDVVGIDGGLSKEYVGTLIFTGCVFLPAGSLQLPAAGISSLVVPTY